MVLHRKAVADKRSFPRPQFLSKLKQQSGIAAKEAGTTHPHVPFVPSVKESEGRVQKIS
jgi:hypothetical protein